MSKRKRKRIKIFKGKFYTTFHTGTKGHPSFVFRVDYINNQYYLVVFDTSGRSDRIMLSVPIENSVEVSFVHKRPVIASHGDLGDHELIGLHISESDWPLIKTIMNKKPLLTRKYKTYLKKIKKAQ